MAHDLDHNHPVVARRGGVQFIDRIGSNAQGGVEPERRIGQRDVVVDGLGQRDDVHALFDEAQGVFLRAAPADANQHIEVALLVDLEHGIGHVHGLTADGHAVGLVPAGAQDRPAEGEDVDSDSAGSSMARSCMSPRKPLRKPSRWPLNCSCSALPTPRIAALRPGASPAGGEDADVSRHGESRVGVRRYRFT
jgi:hypothetical protein